MKKGLVEEVGRADTVGRPILYGTTDAFLKHFGFENIKQLPDIRDIEGLIEEDEAPGEMDGVTIGQISLDELASGENADSEGEAAEPAADADASAEASSENDSEHQDK